MKKAFFLAAVLATSLAQAATGHAAGNTVGNATGNATANATGRAAGNAAGTAAPARGAVASAASAAAAGNVAAPLGLELGKTKCARLTSTQNHVRSGKTPWAGGDAIEIKNLARFNLPGLTRAIVNCDDQDNVALVTLTFERTVLDEVSGKLDGRYEAKRKTESGAQNGYAEWTAANGSLELLSARDGRQFTVAYWDKNAKARYFAYSAAADKKQPAASAPAAKAPAQPAPL